MLQTGDPPPTPGVRSRNPWPSPHTHTVPEGPPDREKFQRRAPPPPAFRPGPWTIPANGCPANWPSENPTWDFFCDPAISFPAFIESPPPTLTPTARIATGNPTTIADPEPGSPTSSELARLPTALMKGRLSLFTSQVRAMYAMLCAECGVPCALCAVPRSELVVSSRPHHPRLAVSDSPLLGPLVRVYGVRDSHPHVYRLFCPFAVCGLVLMCWRFRTTSQVRRPLPQGS